MNNSMGKYRFVRQVESISGFFSQNRASTDAMNVLGKWRRMGQGRAFKLEKGEDEDEQLVAILTFDSSDELAGSHLDALCEQHGVGRQFVS
jgi:hypothetical protein